MLRDGVLAVLQEVVVEHAGDRLARQIHAGRAALLGHGIELVAEALAVGTHPHRLGQRVVHHRRGGDELRVHAGNEGLQAAAGPEGHLDAIALVLHVGHVALEANVLVRVLPHLAFHHVVGDLGNEIAEHLLVVSEAARGDDHGLAVELEIAVGALVQGVDAGHGAVLHDELHTARVEAELGTGLLGRLAVVALHLGLAAVAVAVHRAVEELDGAHGVHHGGVVVLGTGRVHVRHGGHVLVGHAVVVLVDVRAHVLAVAHDKGLIDLVAGDDGPILEELHRIHLGNIGRRIHPAQDLRVVGRRLIAAGGIGVLGLGFQQHDLLAGLRQLASGAHAGVAVADDDGIVGAGILELGRRLGLGTPRGLGRRAALACGGQIIALAGCGRLLRLRGASAQSRSPQHARSEHTCALQEMPARKLPRSVAHGIHLPHVARRRSAPPRSSAGRPPAPLGERKHSLGEGGLGINGSGEFAATRRARALDGMGEKPRSA